MKLLMMSVVLFGSLSSAFAGVGEGFDCRGGGSPQGGKFCHYKISACGAASCEEAAKCAVFEYANEIEWRKTKNLTVVSSKTLANGEEITKVSSADGVVKTVTSVAGFNYNNEAVCQPVAIE